MDNRFLCKICLPYLSSEVLAQKWSFCILHYLRLLQCSVTKRGLEKLYSRLLLPTKTAQKMQKGVPELLLCLSALEVLVLISVLGKSQLSFTSSPAPTFCKQKGACGLAGNPYTKKTPNVDKQRDRLLCHVPAFSSYTSWRSSKSEECLMTS